MSWTRSTMYEHLVTVHGNPEWYVRQRTVGELTNMHTADHVTRFSMGRMLAHRAALKTFAQLSPYAEVPAETRPMAR